MTRHFALILATVVGGSVGPVRAQVLQPWRELAPRGVSLALLRPSFDGGGTSALTTINEVGVRWSIGSFVLWAIYRLSTPKSTAPPPALC